MTGCAFTLTDACPCGHSEDVHGTDQEVDLDGRPTGAAYLVCFDCLSEERPAAQWSHDYLCGTCNGHGWLWKGEPHPGGDTRCPSCNTPVECAECDVPIWLNPETEAWEHPMFDGVGPGHEARPAIHAVRQADQDRLHFEVVKDDLQVSDYMPAPTDASEENK